MRVQAAPGVKVPKENNFVDYITDSVAVDVPESNYYQRRINDGDLFLVETPPAKQTKEPN